MRTRVTGTIDNMAIALTRIAEEAEQRTGKLDLSDLGLASLPEALSELQHLRVLDLGVSDPWSPGRRLNHIDAQRDRLGCLKYEDDGEFIAPDLLPERDDVAAHLPGQWDDDHPTEVAVFRYALLHDGLIRAIMAEVGEAAGPNALYWQGGLCGFEATTRSKLLIEQRMTGSWQGEIQVRTQRGQAPPAFGPAREDGGEGAGASWDAAA